jgi:hypothetical protein
MRKPCPTVVIWLRATVVLIAVVLLVGTFVAWLLLT